MILRDGVAKGPGDGFFKSCRRLQVFLLSLCFIYLYLIFYFIIRLIWLGFGITARRIVRSAWAWRSCYRSWELLSRSSNWILKVSSSSSHFFILFTILSLSLSPFCCSIVYVLSIFQREMNSFAWRVENYYVSKHALTEFHSALWNMLFPTEIQLMCKGLLLQEMETIFLFEEMFWFF